MSADIKDLIESWIEFQRSDNSEFQWTVMAFEKLTRSKPYIAWNAIKTIFEKVKSESWIIGMLASGPLEDLLAQNGELVFHDIELYLAENPRFSNCLEGVWQNLMSDELYEKVKSLRN